MERTDVCPCEATESLGEESALPIRTADRPLLLCSRTHLLPAQ